MNYTNDQTEYMVEEYKRKPSRITVDRLAKELDKSPKSIIGKLSREGVYRRSVYKTKTGETPVTKTELVQEHCYVGWVASGFKEEYFPSLLDIGRVIFLRLHKYCH